MTPTFEKLKIKQGIILNITDIDYDFGEDNINKNLLTELAFVVYPDEIDEIIDEDFLHTYAENKITEYSEYSVNSFSLEIIKYHPKYKSIYDRAFLKSNIDEIKEMQKKLDNITKNLSEEQLKYLDELTDWCSLQDILFHDKDERGF